MEATEKFMVSEEYAQIRARATYLLRKRRLQDIWVYTFTTLGLITGFSYHNPVAIVIVLFVVMTYFGFYRSQLPKVAEAMKDWL